MKPVGFYWYRVFPDTEEISLPVANIANTLLLKVLVYRPNANDTI